MQSEMWGTEIWFIFVIDLYKAFYLAIKMELASI